MSLTTLLVFIPACFPLNMAPGPNNLLSISNATRFGFARACVGGAGRLVAFAIMIGLAAVGLAAVLHTSESLFQAIKLVGAAYLFYLAVQLWRVVPSQAPQTAGTTTQVGRLARQELLIAIGNPKAILIFTAFLPQFIDQQGAITQQFALLGGLFLLLECVAIALYCWMGLYARRLFAKPWGQRLFNRLCAGLLASAASLLLVARRG